MKKFLVLMLAVLMLLCACGKREENKNITLGGITDPENGLLYIDFDNPLIEAEKKEVEVTLSDGTKGTSYMRVPMLNVDLEGAKEVSEEISDALNERYGKYFKKPDDRIVKVDYTSEDINDMLVVILTEEVITPEGSGTMTYTYYYDSLADTSLSMLDFSNYNGAQLATVYEAVLETDWAAEYEEETGNLPYEDVLTGLTCKGDLLFTAYCTNPDGVTQTALELEVEDVPLELPDIEV